MSWNPFGVLLEISATAGTVKRTAADKFTVDLSVAWETYYSGAKTLYGMAAGSGGQTVTLNPFGTSSSGKSGTLTGTYSISGNGAATKTITVTFKNYNSDNGQSATKAINLTVKVPAWTSYAVKYNANGGSGAPSAQTKWKDQKLTLSSTKPTRTGYSFLGWSASSTATSATYSAGGSYTANAAVTLYAVWKANTYTVTYNANGGTLGSVKTQTKTYGVALTLTGTATRSGYNFKGWATTANAVTANYQKGSNYTGNAAITLYAVWEIAYQKPTITNLSVRRCDANENITDEGTYLLFQFDWSCYEDVTSISLFSTSTDDTVSESGTVTASGKSGSVKAKIGNGAITTDKTFTAGVIVTDSQSTTKTVQVSGDEKAIDVVRDADTGEYGVSFGKSAELIKTADFAYKILAREKAVFLNDKAIYGTDTDGEEYSVLIPVTTSGNTTLGYGLYAAEKGGTNIYGNKINFYTKEGKIYINSNDLVFNNNCVIYGKKPDGTLYEALNPQNSNGNVVVGYDNYDNKNGNTNIYGYDIMHGVSNIATPGAYKPYLRRGDEVDVTFYGAGFVTNAKTEVHFMLPLSKPVVGSPAISVTSTDGFIFRQDDKYTHGSSATVHVFPTSMTAYAYHAAGVRVVAVFGNTTNTLNNAPIGIKFVGTITFS